MLALLPAHPRYRESYTTARAERIEVPPAHAVRLLREWSDEADPDGKNLAELERTVYPLLFAATSVRQLRELHDTAQTEPRVLGEFIEFVMIDRKRGALTVLVASDD